MLLKSHKATRPRSPRVAPSGERQQHEYSAEGIQRLSGVERNDRKK